MQLPNFAAHNRKLRIVIMKPVEPAINYVINIYADDTAPRTRPAFAAVFHMFFLMIFCSILSVFVIQR